MSLHVGSPWWFRSTNINATSDPGGQTAVSDLNERLSWKDGLWAPLTALTDSDSNRISPYGTSCAFFSDESEIFSPRHGCLRTVLWWWLQVYSPLKGRYCWCVQSGECGLWRQIGDDHCFFNLLDLLLHPFWIFRPALSCCRSTVPTTEPSWHQGGGYILTTLFSSPCSMSTTE